MVEMKTLQKGLKWKVAFILLALTPQIFSPEITTINNL